MITKSDIIVLENWAKSTRFPLKREGITSKNMKYDPSVCYVKFGKNKKFKGGSPLATSKGSTLVAREGLMNQLKDIYGKKIVDKSILNEKSVLFDDNIENNKEK